MDWLERAIPGWAPCLSGCNWALAIQSTKLFPSCLLCSLCETFPCLCCACWKICKYQGTGELLPRACTTSEIPIKNICSKKSTSALKHKLSWQWGGCLKGARGSGSKGFATHVAGRRDNVAVPAKLAAGTGGFGGYTKSIGLSGNACHSGRRL